MIYFFDFDGTIVDVWRRFYHVFLDAGRISGIDFDLYKTQKLLLKRDKDVASYFGVNLDICYFENKRIMLEQIDYLKLDTLLVDPNLLLCFFENKEAYILTKRRNKENLFKEIRDLKLGNLINKVIIIDPDSSMTKLDYLKKYVTVPFVLIGDSVEESGVSVLNNANVFLVNTGLCDFHANTINGNCKILQDLNSYLEGELKSAI